MRSPVPTVRQQHPPAPWSEAIARTPGRLRAEAVRAASGVCTAAGVLGGPPEQLTCVSPTVHAQ